MVVLVVGFLVTWAASTVALAVVVGVVAGLLAWGAAWAAAPGAVLRIVGAAPAGDADQARVHNLVEGLCAAAGVAKPQVLALDHPSPNAMVVGTSPRRARLVVTTGLVEALSRIELEAVLAHELSHVKSGDLVPATAAVTGLGPVVALFPPAAGWLGRSGGADRELVADVAAVSLTRYPPGLCSALAKLGEAAPAAAAPLVGGLGARLVAHLWLAPPGGDLSSRMEALAEL